MKRIQLANYKPQHFGYSVEGTVATITLNRPERKNPLTFESYQELGDLFHALVYATDIKAVVFTGSGMSILTSGPMISCTSPPEQKLPPEPVNTTALMSVA
jgi:enoyl-CoA hydratase/carnithine racemase